MSRPPLPTQWWVIVLRTGDRLEDLVFYGPTVDEDTARDFAAFLTAEVDPATVHQLRPLEKELLARWRMYDENHAKAAD